MPLQEKELGMVKASTEEILSRAEKSMDELDIIRVDNFIQMILDSEERKILEVGVGRGGFVRAPKAGSCVTKSVPHQLDDAFFRKDGNTTKYESTEESKRLAEREGQKDG